MKHGVSIQKKIESIKDEQKELNVTLKEILSELIKLNKSLPVVKDLIEESETLNSRRKDLKIKSLVAQRQLERSKRSDGNNQ
jgi:hypothetical protein